MSFPSEPKTNMQVYLSHMPMTQAPSTVQPEKLLDVSWLELQETVSLQVELSSRLASTKVDLRKHVVVWLYMQILNSEHKLQELQ